MRQIYVDRKTLLGVWLLTRIIVFVRINSIPDIESDIGVYFNYADNILRGLIPYRDFTLEYPPGALPFFVLPKIWAADLFSFRRLFMMEIMLVDLIGWFLLNIYGQKHGFSDKHMYAAGLLYITLPGLIGLVAYQRFDFIPAVITLAAVMLYQQRRWSWAWIMLGFGFAVKLYPLLLAPIFLVRAYHRKNLPKEIISGIAVALLSAGVFWLPYLFVSGQKFWLFLSYHNQRGIQLESIYSGILIITHWFGYPIKTGFSFGSWNTVSGVSPLLAKMSFLVMIILITAVLVHCFKVGEQRRLDDDDLPRLAGLMILAFIISGKVLSPQYLLWVIPFLVLALEENSRYRKIIWVMTGLLTFLSYLIYPVNYKGLVELDLWPSIILLIRNSLLVGVFYLLWKSGKINRETRKTSEI